MDKYFNQISKQVPTCPVCYSHLTYGPSGEWYCRDCSNRQSAFGQLNEVSGAGTRLCSEIEYIKKIRIGRFPDYESRITKLEKELEQLKGKSAVESEEQEIVLRSLPRNEAVKVIKKYIDENPGCRTSDIILNLEIDPDLVLEIISNLQQGGEIRSEKIE